MKKFAVDVLISLGFALVVVLTIASAEARDVPLAWDANPPPVDSYGVYRAEYDGVDWSAWAQVGTASAESFVDIGLSDTGIFAWYVTARYAGAESKPSNLVLDAQVGLIIPPPPAPTAARMQ